MCNHDDWMRFVSFRKADPTNQKRSLGPQFVKEGVLSIIGVAGDTIRTIDIEIADTESDRTIGLMHRRSMPDTQGMLFIFDEEEPRSFWMRNTLIGLDIIYIRANGEIESIAKYTVPMSERSVPSKGPATYVLEVIEGFCDRYGVKEGDKIAFSKMRHFEPSVQKSSNGRVMSVEMPKNT
jgi:uncharacterized membrane protein (UPF0127 family)